MKLAIIGNGNVGKALLEGLKNKGHDIIITGNDSEKIKSACNASKVIIFAVPFVAINDLVSLAQDCCDGKTIIDVTNALTGDMKLAVGFTTSGAEELQNKIPGAKVVKAFNTVFAEHMSSGKLNGKALTTFIAGDDEEAKNQVMKLASDIGFDAVNAGALQNARLLEPLGYLNIQLGYVLGLGTKIGFYLEH